MSEELPIRQIQGIFFPEHKQQQFHRLNVEYVVSLQAVNRERIYTLLDKGLRANLRRCNVEEDLLCSLRPQLSLMAKQVTQQAQHLFTARTRLRQQLTHTSQGNFSLYKAGMEADFANRNLTEIFTHTESVVQPRLALAEHLLQNTLKINHKDYQAHFELAWLYLFLLERLPEAEVHFKLAARYAQRIDPVLAVLALRHLADTRYSLGKFSEAVHTAQRLLQLDSSDLEYTYEYARYLAASGEEQLAARTLSQVIYQSPLYYLQAQSEPDFAHNATIQTILHDLHAVQVRHIHFQVQTHWQQSELAKLTLPDQISPAHVFHHVIAQQLRAMQQLPYVTLNRREQQIGRMILATTHKRIHRELRLRSRHYETKSEQKRAQWSWVNKIGGFCLHTSSVLLLGALMFFALQGLVTWWGLPLLTPYWLNQVFSSIFILGLTGTFLFQFVPFGVKKLLRKQLELDNTLLLLKSS